MAVINNVPAPVREDSGSGVGFLLGIIILALLAYLFFVYGLPALNANRPAATGGTTIEVPRSLDVNVNTGTDGGDE